MTNGGSVALVGFAVGMICGGYVFLLGFRYGRKFPKRGRK